jgi:hypothetical protein
MNVFEDLIGELKDANLLEDTVIELKKEHADSSNEAVQEEDRPVEGESGFELADNTEVQPVGEDDRVAIVGSDEVIEDSPVIAKPADDREFFRKRAMEEVSSLQMVEHVLAGVEREHMKMPAASYDDLAVKKALHQFMRVSGDSKSHEHAEAEYALLQETQGWHGALSARDKTVSVANIRRFCENSRPVLSSQALMALARFYRNSSFNEEVRGKFDFVMTRLFSRDAGLEMRKMLFGRLEMIGHIKTLYGNWSSISYHTEQDSKEDIELAVQRFDDLVKHFESVNSFDELLNADVFSTIRHFKEECGELFFVPDVAAAAIECNVRLGNKYVELIFKERSERGAARLEEQYGYTYDQAVSNATGKTLLLVDLLKERPEEIESAKSERPEFEQQSFDLPFSSSVINTKKTSRSGIFGVSRWLVVVTVIAAVISGGLYLWADKFAGGSENVKVANELDLEGSEIKAHIRTMRASNETAYAVTQPSWDAMNEQDQKEFLKKVFEFAESKGLKRVNVLNYKGRTVAFVSKDRFEVFGPS